jgi:hypothetical protein
MHMNSNGVCIIKCRTETHLVAQGMKEVKGKQVAGGSLPSRVVSISIRRRRLRLLVCLRKANA